ncbi:hypothetical protein Tco_1556289 [Tanacetum coccineum]
MGGARGRVYAIDDGICAIESGETRCNEHKMLSKEGEVGSSELQIFRISVGGAQSDVVLYELRSDIEILDLETELTSVICGLVQTVYGYTAE